MANQIEPFFDRSFTCPICKSSFNSRAIRGSLVRLKIRETDYHMIYEGLSPLHYSIIVCPICYYAAALNSFSEPIRSQLADQVAIALRTLKRDEPCFNQERDLPTVLRTFQLAVQSAQLRKASVGQLAGSLLGAAWVAREIGDANLEASYLNQARKQYELSYVQDKLPIGSLDEISMAYLIGELYRRTGHYKEAISWFGRALAVRKGSIAPALEKMIRDQWSQARSDAALATEGAIVPTEEAIAPANEVTPTVPAHEPSQQPLMSTKKNRAKVTLNAHVYQDQVEWISKIVNVVYNQGSKITRDEVLRAIVDAVQETMGSDGLKDLAASNELDLLDFFKSKLSH